MILIQNQAAVDAHTDAAASQDAARAVQDDLIIAASGGVWSQNKICIGPAHVSEVAANRIRRAGVAGQGLPTAVDSHAAGNGSSAAQCSAVLHRHGIGPGGRAAGVIGQQCRVRNRRGSRVAIGPLQS